MLMDRLRAFGKKVISFRGELYLAFAAAGLGILAIVFIASAGAQTTDWNAALATAQRAENRMTKVETQQDQILAELKELRESQGTTEWVGKLISVLVTILLGEAGLRVVKKKEG